MSDLTDRIRRHLSRATQDWNDADEMLRPLVNEAGGLQRQIILAKEALTGIGTNLVYALNHDDWREVEAAHRLSVEAIKLLSEINPSEK